MKKDKDDNRKDDNRKRDRNSSFKHSSNDLKPQQSSPPREPIKTTSTRYDWGIQPISSNAQVDDVDFKISIDENIKNIHRDDKYLISRVISDTTDKFANKHETPGIHIIVNKQTLGGIELIEYVLSFTFHYDTKIDSLRLAELQCIHPIYISATPMVFGYDKKTDSVQLVITVSSTRNQVLYKHVRLLQHQVSPLLFNSDDNETGPIDDQKNESIFRSRNKKQKVSHSTTSSTTTNNTNTTTTSSTNNMKTENT